MTAAVTELFNAAIKLNDSDRFELAERLCETLDLSPHDFDELSENEFKAEILRRRDEAIQDPNNLIPWSQVREMR